MLASGNIFQLAILTYRSFTTSKTVKSSKSSPTAFLKWKKKSIPWISLKGSMLQSQMEGKNWWWWVLVLGIEITKSEPLPCEVYTILPFVARNWQKLVRRLQHSPSIVKSVHPAFAKLSVTIEVRALQSSKPPIAFVLLQKLFFWSFQNRSKSTNRRKSEKAKDGENFWRFFSSHQ